MIKSTKKVAPDGGWGWVACFGVSLVNLATRSIEPSFGLLFGDLLKDLDVGTTGASVIISALEVMMNFSGLFVGPLLKEFSYRKVAIAGAFLCSIGLAATSPANSMAHILITYSVINGIGVGLATSAAFVALNHYFKHKRGQAVGLSMAGTALGMLILPQLVRMLLEEYGFRGAVLMLSGVGLHAVVGSVLLQPAKWHWIDEQIDVELMPMSNDFNQIINKDEQHLQNMDIIENNDNQQLNNSNNNMTKTMNNSNSNNILNNNNGNGLVTVNVDDEEDALPELNTLLFNKHNNMRKNYSEVAMSTMSNSQNGGMPKRPTFPRIMSHVGMTSSGADTFSNPDLNRTIRNRKKSVTSNLSLLDFSGSIVHVHINTGDDELEEHDMALRRVNSSHTGMTNLHRDSFIKMKPMDNDKLQENGGGFGTIDDILQQQQQVPLKRLSFWRRFADLMDIDLLKDKIFLNILFGLSIFYVAEMNFKMITPFFFANLNYTKADVAYCLSITAITDIAARVVLPPIFDRINIRKRTVFMISIVFVAITRSIMAEQTDRQQLMIWLSICGFFRGSALSNFTLTVSEYCSLEKLPSAFGWHLVGKAVFVLVLGPLIGAIRDVTQSYPICIHSQSVCIYLCAIAWSIEYFIDYMRNKKKITTEETTDKLTENSIFKK